MRDIKVNYVDFWPGFDTRKSLLPRFLEKHFELEVAENPDFLFYSCFGDEYLRHDCVRIYFTGENRRPDFGRCDYAFTFDHLDHPRHYRLPLYRLYFDETQLTAERNIERILSEPRKFCCMVVSNPEAPERIEFFRALSEHRPVDSGGRLLNNVGGPVADKREFIRNYRFVIAFENSSHPGYTTEKMVEAWVEGCVPIYWGNPRIAEEFNPECFINAHDFDNWESLARRVVEVDEDETLYGRYVGAPLFSANRLPDQLREKNIVARFDRIFREGRVHHPARRKAEKVLYYAKQCKRKILGG